MVLGDYVILQQVMRHEFTIDRFIASHQMQAGLTKMNHQLRLFVEVNLKQQNLFSIFFKSNGCVPIHAVDENKTIDHNYFIENCLKSVVKITWKQRKSDTKCIKLLDDNARPHTHSDVINYLTEEVIIIMSHRPYSLDLAACDYWLNDEIKHNLTDQSPDEKTLARAVVSKMMKKITKEKF